MKDVADVTASEAEHMDNEPIKQWRVNSFIVSPFLVKGGSQHSSPEKLRREGLSAINKLPYQGANN